MQFVDCSGSSLSEETEESALPSAILELRSCTIFGILTQDTHAGNGLTSGTSIFGIYQHMIPNRSKRKRFSCEIIVNFQRKRVKISVTYERDLKIVIICQKYANFYKRFCKVAHSPKSCSQSKKLLKIVKVAEQNLSRPNGGRGRSSE